MPIIPSTRNRTHKQIENMMQTVLGNGDMICLMWLVGSGGMTVCVVLGEDGVSCIQAELYPLITSAN